jgi:muramidase (phage lysozyme)
MTIDEALAFADLSGPYADYSTTVGRHVKATPMGKYAIVGTTLRDLKDHFKLTGKEQFSPELQDRFFLYLFHDTLNKGGSLDAKVARLRKVWEGFKKVSDENLKNAIKNI